VRGDTTRVAFPVAKLYSPSPMNGPPTDDTFTPFPRTAQVPVIHVPVLTRAPAGCARCARGSAPIYAYGANPEGRSSELEQHRSLDDAKAYWIRGGRHFGGPRDAVGLARRETMRFIGKGGVRQGHRVELATYRAAEGGSGYATEAATRIVGGNRGGKTGRALQRVGADKSWTKLFVLFFPFMRVWAYMPRRQRGSAAGAGEDGWCAKGRLPAGPSSESDGAAGEMVIRSRRR